MAVTLITTIGSSTANSFVTVADADAYFAGRPFSTGWRDEDTDNKAVFLKAACELMQDFQWLGSRVNPAPTQALAWPRVNCPNPDQVPNDWGRNYAFNSDVIPQRVKDAQCEIAEAIRAGGADGPLMGGAPMGGFTSLKLGDLTIAATSTATVTSPLQLKRVQQLLDGMVLFQKERSR